MRFIKNLLAFLHFLLYLPLCVHYFIINTVFFVSLVTLFRQLIAVEDWLRIFIFAPVIVVQLN